MSPSRLPSSPSPASRRPTRSLPRIRSTLISRPPSNRRSWYTEPAKVFDDVYFVGTKDRSSWALTTGDGIILIDTTFEYEAEEVIVGGLKKLGLDPASVKYVIISHGHAGEVGGA